MGMYCWYFIEIIIMIWGVISFFGYIFYRFLSNGKIPTWEDGIKEIFLAWGSALSSLYHFFSETIPPEKVINTAYLLTNNEEVELVKRFENHPFETPSLKERPIVANGIVWFDISAIGYISKYESLTYDEFSEMAMNTIQNFYYETRGLKANIQIKVASSKRLYFALAVSEEGRQFLRKQEENIENFEPIVIPEILEEEVDLFLDEKDGNSCG